MAPRLDVAKGSGMGKSCCQASGTAPTAHDDPRWRAILWVALVANAAMFALEMVAGLAADSRALQADALDFLGDAANYAISLGVAGLALAWRARAALVEVHRRVEEVGAQHALGRAGELSVCVVHLRCAVFTPSSSVYPGYSTEYFTLSLFKRFARRSARTRSA